MSQSSIVFGALFIGFIVYVTMKGQLGSYAAVLWGSNAATTAAPQSSSSSSTGTGLTSSNTQSTSSSNLITGRSDDQIGTFLTSVWNGL